MYSNFSEFGLYRYESASPTFRKNRNGIFSSAIFYSIVSMSVIFAIIFYIFVGSRTIEIPINLTKKHSTINSTSNGLEVIEIAARNTSEHSQHAKRIKRLDSEDESNQSPEQQKLIILPSRTMMKAQPRMSIEPKQKVIHYPSALPPNHKISSRKFESRSSHPFRHQQQQQQLPTLNEYLIPPTGQSYYHQVNNIQDILKSNHRSQYRPVGVAPQFSHPNHNHQAQMSQFKQFSMNQMQSMPVQLSGKYRHPRTNVELSQIFQQSQGQLQAEGSDPFRNYKPVSAYEINHMINPPADNHQQKYLNAISSTDSSPYFRRKFRQKIANKYGNDLQASEDRNENPFSVMLDVFPLQGEEQQQQMQHQQMMQMQKMARFRPFMSRYYQDPHFFNTMNFPQLMPRYPPPYFRYQHQPQASSNHGEIQSMQKPSQLIVHLNLYPKNNSAAFKRSSMEEEEEMRHKKQQQQHQQQQQQYKPKQIEPPTRYPKMAMKKNQTLDISSTPFNINFNVLAGNAHPENVMYQKIREFNRTSTEATRAQNYLYDDDDDYDSSQSFNAAPSLVYKNIYRDRPLHMKLKNPTKVPTTMATKPFTREPHPIKPIPSTREPYSIKTNQKFEYLAIKRPKTKYLDYIPKTPGAFHR